MVTPAPGTASPTAEAMPASGAALADLLTDQEQLRECIGKALHDDIGQSVSAIKMTAHLAMDETDPAQVREDMQALVEMADQVVAQLRELHASLYPPQLSVLGLVAALRAELTRQGRTTDTPITLDGDPLPERTAPAIEQAAFRIVQDLVSEALRQPGTRQLQVRLRLLDASTLPLRLEVQADTGADPHTAIPGRCHLRVQNVAGELRSDSSDNGYRIRIDLPYPCASTPCERE